MESKTKATQQKQQPPTTAARISVVKVGELLASPLPTRWTQPIADEASRMKLSAIMESILSNELKSGPSSTD